MLQRTVISIPQLPGPKERYGRYTLVMEFNLPQSFRRYDFFFPSGSVKETQEGQ